MFWIGVLIFGTLSRAWFYVLSVKQMDGMGDLCAAVKRNNAGFLVYAGVLGNYKDASHTMASFRILSFFVASEALYMSFGHIGQSNKLNSKGHI